MYRFDRKVTVLPGKMMPAVAWAQEVAGHITANHGIEVTVGVEQFGEVSALHFLSEVESLAQWEELNGKMLADAALQEKVAESAPGLLVEGSGVDTLVMIVPPM